MCPLYWVLAIVSAPSDRHSLRLLCLRKAGQAPGPLEARIFAQGTEEAAERVGAASEQWALFSGAAWALTLARAGCLLLLYGWN